MDITRTILIMVASTLAVSFGVACSSSSTSGGGGTVDAGLDVVAVVDTGTTAADTGSPADTGSQADTGSVQLTDAGCITYPNEAPLVQQQNVAMDPPTPAGGPAIVDGTYFVSAAAIYTGADGGTGATGANVQSMTVVSGGGTKYALINGVGNGGSTTNGTIATSGAMITITQTRPSPGSVSTYDRFDSNGTTVTIYTSTSPVNSLTYTKQ